VLEKAKENKYPLQTKEKRKTAKKMPKSNIIKHILNTTENLDTTWIVKIKK